MSESSVPGRLARQLPIWLAVLCIAASCSRPGPHGPLPKASGRPASETPQVLAGFWPQFHGPNLDNLSSETGLLKRWPEGGPELVWYVEGVGAGFAGVAVVDGMIYTAGNVDGKTMITALDLDGQIRWRKPNGPAWTREYEGARGTPSVDGDRLFHLSPSGNLIAMDAKTGKELWGRNVLEEFGSKPPHWGLAESVIIDGDRVIATPGGPETCVVALDRKTGRTVWRSASADGDQAGYASPTLAEWGGVRMILQMTAKALVAVDADSGELLFRYPHETRYDVNATRPIFHDGCVVISSNYGTGTVKLKLRVADGRVVPEKLWEFKPLDNHHGGVILVDGYLYGSSNRHWHCVDWQSGQGMYRERGVGKGSLTCADGMLYLLSENGRAGLAAASPEGLELTGQFELPEGGEGKSWAHPVVCGGRLYIRHGDFLYAYHVSAP